VNSTSPKRARVIAVTSGKGGVGKTNVSVNLGVALASRGRRTMLVDCDMGLANANILMGVNANWTIADLLGRHCEMDEILRIGPGGVVLVPGHSGTGTGSKLSEPDRQRLGHALQPYADTFDKIIVDTGSGIGSDSLGLVGAADLVLLVLTPEPTSFMDAYALVKALSLTQGPLGIGVVTNMVANDRAGRELFEHFKAVTARFLEIDLSHLGSIPDDPFVREAVFRKQCCVDAFPSSPAGRAFDRLAARLTEQGQALPVSTRGFFGWRSEQPREALHGAH
jgi:flagellar biosynthesis protein FlhG